ncbi:MAG: hypothetical protein ABI906_04935, partial [Pseudomonadota bacterium]
MIGVWRGIVAGGLMALMAPLAAAQDLSDPTAPALAARGAAPSAFTFTASYIADALADADGGLRTGARYIDQLKVSAAYDGSREGLDGLTGLITIEHHNGANFSRDLVGDAQVVSDVDLPPEAWRL